MLDFTRLNDYTTCYFWPEPPDYWDSVLVHWVLGQDLAETVWGHSQRDSKYWIAVESNSDAPICGVQRSLFYTVCIAPPDHDGFHIAASQTLRDKTRLAVVRIERRAPCVLCPQPDV